jgi:hypothetical protein
MRSLTIALGTLAATLALAADVSAAWNNVYQPTLFGRLRRSTSNYAPAPVVAYAAPVAVAVPTCHTCQSAPQQQCTTNYVQRCYYQPVTTYQSQSYYEPVTTMQTSYYYEPVTSYRYSCYYDPCTCSYQQVATPVTSYSLRAQCCPVQSWVQRCAQVPVTSYQKACYLEPRTTCCQTTVGALIPAQCDTPGVVPNYGAPPAYGAGPPQIHASPPNGVQPQVPAGPPQIKDNLAPHGPNVGNTSFTPRIAYTAQPNWQVTNHAQNKAQAPPVKLERIVFGPESFVEGQIVRKDQTPNSGANILFVSADNGARHTATANAAGRFQIHLAKGNWLVYVPGRDGTPLFHSRVNVNDNQAARINVVN